MHNKKFLVAVFYSCDCKYFLLLSNQQQAIGTKTVHYHSIWKTVTPPVSVPTAIHNNFKSPSNLLIMSAKTKAELLHQLSILQQKEEELVAMIQGIDSTFQELGYRIDSSTNSANNVSLQTGIRMKGQLSFRGKEKAAEYFDMLDIDKDGYLNYEDFRGK